MSLVKDATKGVSRYQPEIASQQRGKSTDAQKEKRGNDERSSAKSPGLRVCVSFPPLKSPRVPASPRQSLRSTAIWYQKLINLGRWSLRVGIKGKFVARITPLLVILSSCQASELNSQVSWNIYRNPRYNFEFPYPNNWVSASMPDNLDGQAFRDPQNPKSEMRGWAIGKLPEIEALPQNRLEEPSDSQRPNFTTEQGVKGRLQVELGTDVSLMTLALSQGKVEYNWQGQCESEQFADCYRIFYYVARNYRLPPPEEGARD